jgi:hypothetical protein
MPLVYLGIFLLAGSILLLEIALTRVFAIMLWHHLAYMVVAVAMLGFGAAGSLLTARRERSGALPASTLAGLAAGYAFATLLALRLASELRVDTLGLAAEPANLAALGALYAIVFLPFLCGGGAIGLALTRLAPHVNRLYGADLLGSAAGGAASVLALGQLGAAGAVTLAAGLGWISAACFALAGRDRGRLLLTSFSAVCGLACLLLAGGVPALGIPALAWKVPYAPGKEFARVPGLADATRLYSATAEVEVGPSQTALPFLGGDFGRKDYRDVVLRVVGQDGTAPTMLLRDAADLETFAFLDDSQAGAAYVAFAARGGEAPRVLVIGAGGGIDVMIALAHGAPFVTAVEINRAMIDMVTDHFDAYLGGLFRRGGHPLAERIDLVHGEGRAFVRQSPERYDVIQLSGVDSFTALSTGAYTLSESYLYTTEAIRDFYEHLADDGYLHFSRFIMKPPKKPRETLRLAHVAYAALQELGIDDPASHVAVFQGFDWASTLIKRGRFTRTEVDALEEFARLEGFLGLVFDPLVGPDGLVPRPQRFGKRARGTFMLALERHRAELGLPDVEEAAASLALAFEQRLAGLDGEARRSIEMLARSGHGSSEVAARLDGWVTGQVRAARRDEASFLSTRREFNALLRSGEAERRAFVNSYEYDVTPSTDDAPFFFNYYRYSGIWGGARSGSDSVKEMYHPDTPVGHMILLGSLAQITAAAVLLILLPLRGLRRHGVAIPGRWQVLGYFGALGAGFMFVEISLMQKLVLFLGHPVYAVTVVLTSLLGFAGVGSLLAGRLEAVTPARIRLLAMFVVGLVLLEALASSQLLQPLLAWPFAARVAAAVVMLAPLAVALGMPFPLGIRVVSARAPELVPWAWAVNGFLSVFSSIFCIVLAMSIGFTRVLLVAALVYACGFLALTGLATRDTRTEDAAT